MNTPPEAAPEAAPEFVVDRVAVALIIALAVVVAPTAILASAWVVTDGFDLAASSWFALVVAALSCGLTLIVLRAALVELRGGLGVRIDARGISKGKVEISWAEVESLEAPSFGLLDIRGGGKQLRVRTYLFTERKQLLEHIARSTGKQVPEMTYSY
ncbi:hypothetical protein ENSA5_16600 [Enhygromyxa salina]|uniref:Uncharacterized protein n=1 Tax=Enhygromyxa salina TaxID=215803 RepID=A0A2S9YE92_9BACT|nr:hypothetical protein [Enhygromyxa salina]PRQ03352.1 hypothetical protein ENSA5_16600 [Enhygromyxa salina]